MTDAFSSSGPWARRWPRYLGAILLVAAAQAGIGAWALGGDADGISLAAYLGGCAATAGFIGLLLCLVPLPVAGSDSSAQGLPRKSNN